jgi:UDPglucose 6-dehydrogenase/UDP-N-acetyl-D-galactosamine dehydrogenase
MSKKMEDKQKTICVVGLGYVGLPLARAFSKHYKVIGLDNNINLVEKLNQDDSGNDITFTCTPELMKQADFIIMTVPTPVTEAKDPDLSYIINSAQNISCNIKVGCTVVIESTVYPGTTEEVVIPILEESGLRCGKDFNIAYSPERINPGDDEHALDKVTKVVGGLDRKTTDLVAELYSSICPAIHKTKNIKTAEAAKVIENIQRDLNIALVNELSLIFDRMDLNTRDILEAADTKWNFNLYQPGLVGGHCIPVDPYYLVHKAKQLDYYPQVILAGRAINDNMPKYIAQKCIKGLIDTGKVVRGSKVLIMGLTYKEDVPDTRETPAKKIINELREYGIDLYGYDPLIKELSKEFGIKTVNSIGSLTDIDALILTVNHRIFRRITLSSLKAIMSRDPVLIDVRCYYDETEAKTEGFYYWAT